MVRIESEKVDIGVKENEEPEKDILTVPDGRGAETSAEVFNKNGRDV